MVQLLIGSVLVQVALVALACVGLAAAHKRQDAMAKKLALMERQCRRHSNLSELQVEVGQNLSCLSILLQVAEKYRHIKPEKADGAIRQAKHLTTASLNSIRQLKQLSESTESTTDALSPRQS